MVFKHAFTRFEWELPENYPNPRRFTDDFSEDLGYFTEENGTHDWKIENGVLKTSASGKVNVTYLHVFEANVRVKARIRVTRLGADPKFAILARYNDEETFVRGIYYGNDSTWGFDYQEGADFNPFRTRVARYPLEMNKWCDVEFLLEGKGGLISADGTDLMSVSDFIAHDSPGRIGFAAQDMDVEIDSVDITLLSGYGTVMKDVIHHKLPDNEYREGGTVVEMDDGSLAFLHPYCGCGFRSTDMGESWERTEIIVYNKDRNQVLRLNNGKYINIDRVAAEEPGKELIVSFISEDGCKTWKRTGTICKTPYNWNTAISALNMNDKVTETSYGRIFYPQTFCGSEKVNGFDTFTLIYYSDDDGYTWQVSETGSWDMKADIDFHHFAEGKVVECSDGTLRLYCSHNPFGCIVYSESFDRGVTWGPIVRLEGFECACSSMQFFRDPYAENATTYYMVWVSSPALDLGKGVRSGMPRSRLTLAVTTDGKNWTNLGDVWRKEGHYANTGMISHLVDTFITVTKDYVFCGSGISEQMPNEYVKGNVYHQAQRQHIYRFKKSSLAPSEFRGALEYKVHYYGVNLLTGKGK